MKKIIKQNLRFYSKICLFIGAIIAFICSFGTKSYAWHEENGNLQSDNLYNIGNYSSAIFGVNISVQNQTLTLNGTSSNGSWSNRTDMTLTLNSGTYTIQWFTDYQYNNIGFGLYSNASNLSELYRLNSQRYRTFTINETTTFSTVIWWQASNMSFNNLKVSCMVYSGNYKAYTMFESYGKTYYSYDVVEKASLGSYGCFKYADSIRVYYNDGTNTHLYKMFDNITDFTMEKYVRMINNSIKIDDYTLIFTLLNGNSNWKWAIYVTFPNGKVKASDFQEWSLYGQVDFSIKSFTSGVEYSYNGVANPQNVDLLNQGFSSNDYISNVLFQRLNPNIGLSYGQFGTPNINSTYYNNGYDSGYAVGYDNGYEYGEMIGYENGKNYGYDLGFQDGEESDFTTNGFKTLIGSIFNYPINMIRSIFNFEFMGINIFSIIVFVVSIGIVIFVIRRFKK